ncbi:glycosyltransferase family 2 protein [Streptomyces bugieae]|uniref:Glycosyltransferase n=1 Tax=Streptomyces bugieae TaxID=3098223 RepID=A0ABU7NHV6_9ACTN|nr:glycosyltransferase [Streptomyces sp. DSM 41528]
MTAPADRSTDYTVVIPTLGRPGLTACLAALAAADGPLPRRVILVDDRPLGDGTPLPADIPGALRERTVTVPGHARGPAAARNTGWRAGGGTPWIVFLDDDVLPGPAWARELAADLAAATPRTAGVSARIDVPLPAGREPTDWERHTAALATSRWSTADMAYRRAALDCVGGFDERFRSASREDADLALRVLTTGWTLAEGRRSTTHPVRPADRWVSVRLQAGHADDVLMTRRHGRGWWHRARTPRGRFPGHLAVTAAAAGALLCGAAGERRAASVLAALWLAGTAEFAWARIAPGPRTREETRTVALTSVLIPPAATAHWLCGLLRHHATAPVDPWGGARPAPDVRPRPAPERV